MKTGKTFWGIEQIGEKERQRVNILEERQRSGIGERGKWLGLILTVGENQHLSIFRNVNQ